MIAVDVLKRFEVHSILLIAFLCLVQQFAAPEDMPVGVDFEVYGRVQGKFYVKVVFQKFCFSHKKLNKFDRLYFDLFRSFLQKGKFQQFFLLANYL